MSHESRPDLIVNADYEGIMKRLYPLAIAFLGFW
jgi:hypothetical protein